MSLFKDFIISPDHVVNLGLRHQGAKEKRGGVEKRGDMGEMVNSSLPALSLYSRLACFNALVVHK
jgi:hypothetical protein